MGPTGTGTYRVGRPTLRWHRGRVDPIDWEDLRRTVRAKHGWEVDSESFGTEEARLALVHLIGDDAMRAAVDYYVDSRPARELARCALMILRPPSGPSLI